MIGILFWLIAIFWICDDEGNTRRYKEAEKEKAIRWHKEVYSDNKGNWYLTHNDICVFGGYGHARGWWMEKKHPTFGWKKINGEWIRCEIQI